MVPTSTGATKEVSLGHFSSLTRVLRSVLHRLVGKATRYRAWWSTVWGHSTSTGSSSECFPWENGHCGCHRTASQPARDLVAQHATFICLYQADPYLRHGQWGNRELSAHARCKECLAQRLTVYSRENPVHRINTRSSHTHRGLCSPTPKLT